MSLRVAVIHEAEADFRTATQLAERVLLEAIDWLDDDLLANQLKWISEVPGQGRLTWKSIPRLAQAARIRAHGHIDGNPLEIDAGAVRRAILCLKVVFEDLAGIVLIRDRDDQPERRRGMDQGRSEHRGSPKIVIGLAIVEREAWVISGFEPQDADEQTRLDAERQTLGFYPHSQSHQLTACKDDRAPRSPKRVLRLLTGGDFDRERQCWTTTPLARLRERGRENGLMQYLEEVRTLLAPLIGYVDHRTE